MEIEIFGEEKRETRAMSRVLGLHHESLEIFGEEKTEEKVRLRLIYRGSAVTMASVDENGKAYWDGFLITCFPRDGKIITRLGETAPSHFHTNGPGRKLTILDDRGTKMQPCLGRCCSGRCY